MKQTNVILVPLRADDREQFILDNQRAFKYGALEEFEQRDDHLDNDGEIISREAIECAIDASDNETYRIMCPAMSFIAAFLYYNYQAGFNMWTLLADWLKLVCFNFPFAFFPQLFFIQPTVRTIFKFLFAKDIKNRENLEEKQAVAA